jgi:hypothetical protein
MCACSDLVQWSAANESRLLVGTDGGGRLLVDRLVAQGHPRDTTEVAVEGWLGFVRADCVKSVDSQNISWTDRTEMCLRAFDCARIPDAALVMTQHGLPPYDLSFINLVRTGVGSRAT